MDFEEWKLKSLPKRFEELIKRYESEFGKVNTHNLKTKKT